jgi:hypothetical protein
VMSSSITTSLSSQLSRFSGAADMGKVSEYAVWWAS